MRTTRITAALGLAAGLTALSGAPALASSANLYNCSDFVSQEEAQATFEASGPGDPNRLDEDDDGVACESLPSNGGTPVESAPLDDIPDDAGEDDEQMVIPSGGVDAGSGGTSTDSTGLYITGGLLAAAGVSTLVVTRRRSQG